MQQDIKKIRRRTSSFKKDLRGKKFGELTPIKWLRGGKWECACSCGNTTTVDTRNLMSGHTKSCGCILANNGRSRIKNLKGMVFGHVLVIEEAGRTKGKNVRWKCVCEKCGREFITKAGSLLYGTTRSCGCVNSYGEERIFKILSDSGIEFATQYTFPDLRGKQNKPLRFDFAVFKNKVLQYLIEYNGEQHYRKVPGSFGESYDRLIECDNLKRKYCEANHIKLITIRYDEEISKNNVIPKNL